MLLALRSLVEVSIASGTGSSTGADTATGVGAWNQAGTGSSAGANTATGVGAWNQSGVGSSAGSDTAAATGAWNQAGIGSSAGSSTASGVGARLQAGIGSSVGGNIANGASPLAQADFNNDFAEDFSGFPGAEAGIGTGDFNNDFNDDFAVFHVGNIVSGVGLSVGGNIATAVGSTEVFIPPVYPPVVVPVKVWHPAQEYHRVQAPRATRVYRRGTELQRRPPQGMKRRYG